MDPKPIKRKPSHSSKKPLRAALHHQSLQHSESPKVHTSLKTAPSPPLLSHKPTPVKTYSQLTPPPLTKGSKKARIRAIQPQLTSTSPSNDILSDLPAILQDQHDTYHIYHKRISQLHTLTNMLQFSQLASSLTPNSPRGSEAAFLAELGQVHDFILTHKESRGIQIEMIDKLMQQINKTPQLAQVNASLVHFDYFADLFSEHISIEVVPNQLVDTIAEAKIPAPLTPNSVNIKQSASLRPKSALRSKSIFAKQLEQVDSDKQQFSSAFKQPPQREPITLDQRDLIGEMQRSALHPFDKSYQSPSKSKFDDDGLPRRRK